MEIKNFTYFFLSPLMTTFVFLLKSRVSVDSWFFGFYFRLQMKTLNSHTMFPEWRNTKESPANIKLKQDQMEWLWPELLDRDLILANVNKELKAKIPRPFCGFIKSHRKCLPAWIWGNLRTTGQAFLWICMVVRPSALRAQLSPQIKQIRSKF